MLGIYYLYWEKSDKIYIGQGIVNIRLNQHLSSMRKGTHSNYKIQEQYNLYGEPIFKVIQEANENNVNELEISWIKEYDSVNTGLNILPGGTQMRGLNHPRSKYSRKTILKALCLLTNKENTYQSIHNRIGMSLSAISSIALGKGHTWVQEEYPNKFKQMQFNRNIIKKSLKLKYPKLIFKKTGEIFEVNNISEFCRSRLDLQNTWNSSKSSIRRVLTGERSHHKGYYLYEE